MPGLTRTIGALAVAAATLLTAAACGSPPLEELLPTAASPTGPAPSAPRSSATATTTSPPVDPDSTVVDISIAGGRVNPTNAQVQSTAGRLIVLRVSSDVADQLHVHSVPEHTFQVQPQPGQTFEFTVEVPGRVDVELHDLSRTVVTILVRP